MATLDIRHYVDVERYRVHQRGSAGFDDLVSSVRAALAEDGCAVLPSFIRRERIAELVAEADRVAPFGHRSFSRTNVYFTRDDPDLPLTHPLRRFYDRSNAFVPADHFDQGSILRSLYEWPPFFAFIQSTLGEQRFHRYADPLADVIINVVEEGGGFPWHFDTNNFTVTLAIQDGTSGGEFEYCPGIRTPDDENYDRVEAVLDGDRARVRTLTLKPGDLQIFKGRYSLHRVKPVRGKRRRYVAIFSFVQDPDMVGSPERTRQLYGRVLPVHLERAGRRTDTLID